MSIYFTVHLRTPEVPDGLVDAHAGDAVYLNARGRPCAEERAAWLESEELARALLQASRHPLIQRFGENLKLGIRQFSNPEEVIAERIARDSDTVRDFLATQ